MIGTRDSGLETRERTLVSSSMLDYRRLPHPHPHPHPHTFSLLFLLFIFYFLLFFTLGLLFWLRIYIHVEVPLFSASCLVSRAPCCVWVCKRAPHRFKFSFRCMRAHTHTHTWASAFASASASASALTVPLLRIHTRTPECYMSCVVLRVHRPRARLNLRHTPLSSYM